MTDPCPRCAELEARLANFERETFTELRARVGKLEAIRQLANDVCVAMHPPEVQTAIHKLHGALWELTKDERGKLPEPFKTSGYVYLPESADPTANPTRGSYHWIDQDGKAWIRTSEGNVYPHPLFKVEK